MSACDALDGDADQGHARRPVADDEAAIVDHDAEAPRDLSCNEVFACFNDCQEHAACSQPVMRQGPSARSGPSME